MNIKKILRSISSILIVFITAVSMTSCTALLPFMFHSSNTNESSKADNSNMLYGKWVASDGRVFIFHKDNSYEYYIDKSNLNDNYYKGNYQYSRGEEAMKDLGITDKEFNQTFSKYGKDKSRIYNIVLHASKAYEDGKDVTENYKNKHMEYFFQITDNTDKAIAASLTTYTQISLERQK